MKKGTFEDLLPQETVERMLLSRVSVGEVFRMHLGKEENIKGKNPGDDGRNKYFVVLGHDLDGNAIGVVIIKLVFRSVEQPKTTRNIQA